ncbi:MAG TPA: hypothetical protein PK957_04590 [Candidatus Dojkabacteria bacterium]|nr:hypothetical protein [Candidatus Dojkabacteria bacterium]HQF36657.1 hypothetical protein [Candidatus Dojkabacteria bacterium]
MSIFLDPSCSPNPETLKAHINWGQKLAPQLNKILNTFKPQKHDIATVGTREYPLWFIYRDLEVVDNSPYEDVLRVLVAGDVAGKTLNPSIHNMYIELKEFLLINGISEDCVQQIRNIIFISLMGDTTWADENYFSICKAYGLETVERFTYFILKTAELIKDYRISGQSAIPLHINIDEEINEGDVITALAWLYEPMLKKDSN